MNVSGSTCSNLAGIGLRQSTWKQLEIFAAQTAIPPVAPLRITKSKSKSSIASASATSSSSLSSATSSSSVASSTSSATSYSHAFASAVPPLPIQAMREVHHARHASWELAVRLVDRAEAAFERALWGGKDVEAASARLRIAREEEAKCRSKVDAAAMDLIKIRKKMESGKSSISSSSSHSRTPSLKSTKTASTSRSPLKARHPNSTASNGVYSRKRADTDPCPAGEAKVMLASRATIGPRTTTAAHSVHLVRAATIANPARKPTQSPLLIPRDLVIPATRVASLISHQNKPHLRQVTTPVTAKPPHFPIPPLPIVESIQKSAPVEDTVPVDDMTRQDANLQIDMPPPRPTRRPPPPPIVEEALPPIIDISPSPDLCPLPPTEELPSPSLIPLEFLSPEPSPALSTTSTTSDSGSAHLHAIRMLLNVGQVQKRTAAFSPAGRSRPQSFQPTTPILLQATSHVQNARSHKMCAKPISIMDEEEDVAAFNCKSSITLNLSPLEPVEQSDSRYMWSTLPVSPAIDSPWFDGDSRSVPDKTKVESVIPEASQATSEEIATNDHRPIFLDVPEPSAACIHLHPNLSSGLCILDTANTEINLHALLAGPSAPSAPSTHAEMADPAEEVGVAFLSMMTDETEDSTDVKQGTDEAPEHIEEPEAPRGIVCTSGCQGLCLCSAICGWMD